MTEDEAKTKWCPFVRMQAPGQSIINRISRAMWRILKPGTSDFDYYKDIEADCNCIGSACMAWRWDYAWAQSTQEGQGGDLVLRLKPLNGKPRMGWCGLAGKP